VPLAGAYHVNIQTGVGELSATRCRELVDRAEAHGRPVRILYVSDFDPGGRSMPVAVARKIEFELYRRGIERDIQVRPVALSHDQCVEYQLPRTPLKDTERRRAIFEKRFGEGATELDALEALHPGLLRRVLLKEIHRYWDPDHAAKVEETCNDIRVELDKINGKAAGDPEIGALMTEFDEIKAEHDAWCRKTEATMKDELAEISKKYEAWIKRTKPVWHATQVKLDENAPNINDLEWAGPGEIDEDGDPLFDSTRGYVEQVDRYKAHQGKSTARLPRSSAASRKSQMAGRQTVRPFTPEGLGEH
jgi:hypothetical protein